MPPIELWGPATWTLFHVLAENVNEHIYPRIAGQLFDVIKRICTALPCPECAQDATQFLAKVKLHELKSKNDFKNLIYVFHNYVNAKKKKPLFKYINLEVYKRYNIVSVFNRFISFYHTKGNMRLLAESFQRQLIVKNVREWFSRNICFFMQYHQPVPNVEEPTHTLNKVLSEPEVSVNSETPFLSPLEVVNAVTENAVTENAVTENAVTENAVTESAVTESAVTENAVTVEDPFGQDPLEEKYNTLNEVEESASQVEPEVAPEVEPEVAPEVEPEVAPEVEVPEVEATKPKRGRKKKTA
jgi:hypothetical protein